MTIGVLLCMQTQHLCMYQENIYKNNSENRLNSNEEFKLVTNKRSKKSSKKKVNSSKLTHTFKIKGEDPTSIALVIKLDGEF
jgi:hypothetical protein